MSIVQRIKNALSNGGNAFDYKFNQGSIGGVVCNFELNFTKTIEGKTQFNNVIGKEGVYADFKLPGGAIYDVSLVLGVSSDISSSISSLTLFNTALKEIEDTLKPKIIDGFIQGQFIFSHPLYGTNITACLDGDITTESPGIGGSIKFRLREILNDLTEKNILDFQKIQKSSANQKKNNIFDKIKNTIQNTLTYANSATNEITNATSFFNTFANTLVSFSAQLSSLQSNILGVTQNYSNFLNAVQTFKGNIQQFTTTPTLLANNLSDIYAKSSQVFINNNPSFVKTSLNDNITSPFFVNVPKNSTNQEEINRYYLLDISYKANLLCNFGVAMYDYKFNDIKELRTIFNKFYTLYQDLSGYRIFLYENEYKDRIYFDNTEPSQEIIDIIDLIKDLCVNILAEFQAKKFTLTQYKTFYANIPYTLIGLHYLLYNKAYVESEGEDLININQLKDLTNITGLIKYIVYE